MDSQPNVHTIHENKMKTSCDLAGNGVYVDCDENTFQTTGYA